MHKENVNFEYSKAKSKNRKPCDAILFLISRLIIHTFRGLHPMKKETCWVPSPRKAMCFLMTVIFIFWWGICYSLIYSFFSNQALWKSVTTHIPLIRAPYELLIWPHSRLESCVSTSWTYIIACHPHHSAQVLNGVVQSHHYCVLPPPSWCAFY